MKFSRGFTLVELLVSVAVFAIVLTLAFTFLILSKHYFAQGAASAGLQNAAQMSTSALARELQESDPAGLYVNGSHDAIVFVSARDHSGDFKSDQNSLDTTFGQPIWQTWVCYYLVPQAGTSNFQLMRMEGNPTGSGFPSTTVPSPAPTDANFKSSKLPAELVAQNVETFDIEDDDCDPVKLESPLEIQIKINGEVLGRSSTLNPGILNPFTACSKAGYWFPVTMSD